MLQFLQRMGLYDKISRLIGSGEMAERFKAPVLKTGLAKANVGSNPSLSAWFFFADRAEKALTIDWGGARVADWARLLSECWALNSAAG